MNRNSSVGLPQKKKKVFIKNLKSLYGKFFRYTTIGLTGIQRTTKKSEGSLFWLYRGGIRKCYYLPVFSYTLEGVLLTVSLTLNLSLHEFETGFT